LKLNQNLLYEIFVREVITNCVDEYEILQRHANGTK